MFRRGQDLEFASYNGIYVEKSPLDPVERTGGAELIQRLCAPFVDVSRARWIRSH